MTHAAHFLQRLDRLSARHTEEALLLYNDPPLLLSILELARVPERIERVALALDDEGPYILITRSGHFVTCLATGMKIDDVPIISRQQLDHFTEKVGELRARFALAASLVGTDQRGAQKLVSRLTKAGADLSREEFAALVLWQPMLVRDLLRSLFQTVDYLTTTREQIAATRLGKNSRAVERVLRDYWNAYWAAGHLSMLLATGDAWAFEGLPPEVSEEMRALFAWGTIRQGGVGLALRGAWTMGRFGEEMLPSVERSLREARTPTQYITAALSLIALATRHSNLRDQVLKELGAEQFSEKFYGEIGLRKAIHEETVKSFEDPETAAERTRTHAENILEGRRKVRHLASVALPVSRQIPVISLDISNFHLHPKIVVLMPWLLSRMAGVNAETLYLPSADLDTFGYGPWVPGFSSVLLRPLISAPPAPVKAPETVGRNDPCACGSGKKSKKCCAA